MYVFEAVPVFFTLNRRLAFTLARTPTAWASGVTTTPELGPTTTVKFQRPVANELLIALDAIEEVPLGPVEYVRV